MRGYTQAPHPLKQRDPAIVHAVRCTVARILEEGETAAKVTELVDTARLWALDLINHLPSPPRSVACKAGCPWCCYVPVAMTAAEAIRITEYLHTMLSHDEIDAVRERIADLDERTHHMNEDARALARLPCPLLDDSLCSVYPVRPLACIAWNSFDAEACKAAWFTSMPATVPTHAPCYQAVMSIRKGLREGLADVELESKKLDLTTALRIALETPDGTNRWLAGEPVFAPARWENRLQRSPTRCPRVETPSEPRLEGQARGKRSST